MVSRCRQDRGLYRDVSVCERWLSFDAFLADMGERPSLEHSIDRIDAAGDYEPGNCRWATWAEQMRNKRTTVELTHPDTGVAMCMADWARELGVRKSTLHYRLKRWPLRRVLTGRDHRRKTDHLEGSADHEDARRLAYIGLRRDDELRGDHG